jgi:hypothetical protein
MFDLPTEDPVQVARVKPHVACCAPDSPGDGYGEQCRPQVLAPTTAPLCPVTSEDLANFIHDPMAFAKRAGAPAPEAFVKAYLQGLEARLAGTVGAPKAAAHRLATLTADTLLEPAAAPCEGPMAPVGDRPDGLNVSPRMGPVVVACAVVTAVTSVVQCAAVVSMCLAKRSAN